MATQKFKPAASESLLQTPSEGPQSWFDQHAAHQRARPAEEVHEEVLALLDEIDAESTKVFAVASGGVSYAGTDNITEANLFQVIKDLTETVTVSSALRSCINELARRAGSTYQLTSES